MTTSSANNSVFREQPIPPAPVALEGQQVASEILATHTAWIKGSKEIVGLMLMTMKQEIQQNLENLHAHEMLQELKSMFAQQAKQELLQTTELAIQGLRASRKLKPRALSLYVGNGQREAAEAIDVFYLCLPSGLEIVLKNYHYAPSITRGVIFVSCLNNMVYFSAIPRDGIFEINLSNSYANDSSTYAISNKRDKLDLDSTLLWHCRLGHISKKRIEKLQHDGLLNSTDLRAFKKCVSCMSGKMARKPYKHQVERAKDLLGLIHTDVCGPFKIMSRQGASYFVTFTDDFSRYGHVYLLKHKHEVFETFKVFQNEVENQLDIRAIRILIAIAVFYDYEIRQMDVKTVFLNGYLFEEVYIEQPEDVKSYLGRCFAMKDLGETAYILGIKIYRDRSRRLIGLFQSDYIEKILKRYHMENSKRGSSNMYDVRCTRPDVAFAQNITSRFQQNPGDLHWTTIKNILKYLRNTKDMFLVYGGDIKRELRVSCYTNVGYLTDADDLKSQTGYVFVLNGGVVDWKSFKQSIFATSSAEVEYIAAFDASKEAVWVKKFIYGLGVVLTIEEPIVCIVIILEQSL
nr:hypothetical protein [Tanacetum cinerariifolium]